MSALANLGYKPEQVTKILVTHKHEDHTGELRSFPNAKIYLAPEEADALKLDGPNVVRVKYESGPYHTFDASEKIADGVYLLPAKGHTMGNSIIVAECDGLFYMMHGDITYTDEALYANKLSIIYEDQALRRVQPFANDSSNLIRFHVEGGTLQLDAEDYDFSKTATERMSCEYNGQPMSIGFKGSSFIEILGNFDCQEVTIQLADPSRAGLVLPSEQPENQDVLMLMMPMLIND